MSSSRGNQQNRGRQQQQSDRQPPTWSRRVGGIEVSVWRSVQGEGQDAREQHTVTIKKTYKAEDEYVEAKSFFPNEVPVLAALLQDAFSAIGNG